MHSVHLNILVPSPRTGYKTLYYMTCPINLVLAQYELWIEDKVDYNAIIGRRSSHLYQGPWNTNKSNSTKFSDVAFPTLLIFSGIRTEHGHPESLIDLSSHHFGTHNISVLGVWSTHFQNFHYKSCCAATIEFALTNNSTTKFTLKPAMPHVD